MFISAPDRTEFADYYLPYVEKVAGDDVMTVLANQPGDVLPLLEGVSEERSLHRYAPDKWSIRHVLGYVTDTGRLFSFRAFWFALRRRVASGNPFSVRALAYICAGHMEHHVRVLRERYLTG